MHVFWPQNNNLNWSNFPLFRVLLPLVAGILVAYYFLDLLVAFSSVVLLFSGGCFLLILVFPARLKYQTSKAVLFLLLFFSIGLSISLSASTKHAARHFSKFRTSSDWLIVSIKEQPKLSEKSARFIASVHFILDHRVWKSCEGNLYCSISKSAYTRALKYGSNLLLQGTILRCKPDPDSDFDFSAYLAAQDVYHRLEIKSPGHCFLLSGFSGRGAQRLASAWQQKLEGTLKANGLEGNALAVASALLLGDKVNIDPSTLRDFSVSGAMHVLSVSGLHVAVLFLLLSAILRPLKRSPYGNLVRLFLLLIALLFYSFLTGLSPSVCRAATMLAMISIAEAFDRKGRAYNTLAATAGILLFADPWMLLETGFQLSFLAVIGILFFSKSLIACWHPKNKLLRYCWELIGTSVAAQLTTFPLAVYSFHQFPNYFLLSNLFLIPLASCALYLGVLLLVVSPLPLLKVPVAFCLNAILSGMNLGTNWVAHLPFASSGDLHWTGVQTCCVYGSLVFFALFMHHRRWMHVGLILISITVFQMVGFRSEYHRKEQTTLFCVAHRQHLAFLMYHSTHASLFFVGADRDSSCVARSARRLSQASLQLNSLALFNQKFARLRMVVADRVVEILRQPDMQDVDISTPVDLLIVDFYCKEDQLKRLLSRKSCKQIWFTHSLTPLEMRWIEQQEQDSATKIQSGFGLDLVL